MIWYLGILALIILAVYSRRFRRVLLIGTGLLVCAVMHFVYSWHREGQEYERSKNRISLNEVEMADLRLAPRAGSGSNDMVGRITNKPKQYTLKEVS